MAWDEAGKWITGEASQAQFHAFTDTWNWADAAQTYAEFVDNCPNTAAAPFGVTSATSTGKISSIFGIFSRSARGIGFACSLPANPNHVLR